MSISALHTHDFSRLLFFPFPNGSWKAGRKHIQQPCMAYYIQHALSISSSSFWMVPERRSASSTVYRSYREPSPVSQELCSCEVEVTEKVHYDTGVRSILWWWKVWTLLGWWWFKYTKKNDDEREREREKEDCVWRVYATKEGAQRFFFFFTPLLFCLALLLFFGDKLMMDHVLCITVGNKNKKNKNRKMSRERSKTGSMKDRTEQPSTPTHRRGEKNEREEKRLHAWCVQPPAPKIFSLSLLYYSSDM